ncbi:MAG: GAF domain-containing protein [Caulobacteraceae bacterium]|nr:GAF domain-containing protein [Caulobacteraceae bacterium]
MPRRSNSARRRDEIARLRDHRRVLTGLAQSAAASLDLQSFLDEAILRVAATLEIERAKLLRYRREHNDLLMEAGVGWDPGIVNSAAFATDLASSVGRAFQTGQPVVVSDMRHGAEFRQSEVLQTHGIVSLMNVPILVGGAAWGVIEVDSAIPRDFDDDEVTFMAAVAALVGLTIRRADEEAGRERAAISMVQEIEKRELLLREMQHRVKNNFQTILGMIALRMPAASTEVGRDLLNKIANGIMAMSLAHDQLSPGRTGEVVGLAAYLRVLSSAFVPISDKVTIEVKCDEANVSIEQAVAVGLIVNELVTNSLKHAFGPDGGAIRVELHAAGPRRMATLTVADTGKGHGERGESDGSGSKLVKALAAQVRGELVRTRSPEGFATSLHFVPRAR